MSHIKHRRMTVLLMGAIVIGASMITSFGDYGSARAASTSTNFVNTKSCPPPTMIRGRPSCAQAPRPRAG